MDLRDIVAVLEGQEQVVSAPTESPRIAGVVDDSRQVLGGELFCAVTGTVADGHDFVADAASRGGVAALVTHPVDVALPQVVVRDCRIAAAAVAAAWYDTPGDAMVLIGVTGTNGKSTTVSLIRHLLNRSGDAGVLGTLGSIDGSGAALPTQINLTTPGPVQLQAALAAFRDRGVKRVAMEVSSHALHQKRVAGLDFRAVVYTNLTHEHLDYHGTLDSYREAKFLLSDHLVEGGVEVVNADDPAWAALPARSEIHRLRYGLAEGAEVRATEVELDSLGTNAVLSLGDCRERVRIPMPGMFNVSNSLAAAATAWGLGMDPGELAAGLERAPQVTGRMERLASDGYTVLRDYAHTPDAMERVLRTLRAVTEGRLVVLFGCGGDRDSAKRPVMGEIAAREADLVVLTTDNPRSENPAQIIAEIEVGMPGVAHLSILDRREAIEQALAMLVPGDCLLLAGKGHETYQLCGTEKVPFDERRIVRDALGVSDP